MSDVASPESEVPPRKGKRFWLGSAVGIIAVALAGLFFARSNNDASNSMVGVAYFDDGESDGYSFGLSIEEALAKPKSRELNLEPITVVNDGRSYFSSFVSVGSSSVGLTHVDDGEWFLSLFDVDSRELTNLARSTDLPDDVVYLTESSQFVVSTTGNGSETCVMFSTSGERIVLGKGICSVLPNQDVLLVEDDATFSFEVFDSSGRSRERVSTRLMSGSVFFDASGRIFAGLDETTERMAVVSRSGEELWTQEYEWMNPEIVEQKWDGQLAVLTDSGAESVIAHIFSTNGDSVGVGTLELPGVVSFKSNRDGSVLALGISPKLDASADWFISETRELGGLDLSTPSYRGRVDRFFAEDGRVLLWDGEASRILAGEVGSDLVEVYETEMPPFFDSNQRVIYALVDDELSTLNNGADRLDFLINDVAAYEFPPEAASTIIVQDSEDDEYLYELRSGKAILLDLRDAILSATRSASRVWYSVLENDDVKLYSVELSDAPRPRLEADDTAVLPQRSVELLDRSQGESSVVYEPWIDEQRVQCEENGSTFLTLNESFEIEDVAKDQELCFTVTTDLLGNRDEISVDVEGESSTDTWLEIGRLGATLTTADDIIDESTREILDSSPLVSDLTLERGTITIRLSAYDEVISESGSVVVRLHDNTVEPLGVATEYGDSFDATNCSSTLEDDQLTLWVDSISTFCVKQNPSNATPVTVFNDGSSRLLTASLDVACDVPTVSISAGTSQTIEVTPGKGVTNCRVESTNGVPMVVDILRGNGSVGEVSRANPLDFDTTSCGIYNSTEALPLSRCDVGLGVSWIQETLQGSAAADGYFGTDTKKSVILFQREQGLPVSGEVDSVTWTALGLELGSESCAVGERVEVGDYGSRFSSGSSVYFCVQASGSVYLTARSSTNDIEIMLRSGVDILRSSDFYSYSTESIFEDLDGEDYVFEVASVYGYSGFNFYLDIYNPSDEYYADY